MTMYWLGVFQFLSNFLSLGLEADYIQHTTYSASSDKSGRSILYSVFIANFSSGMLQLLCDTYALDI